MSAVMQRPNTAVVPDPAKPAFDVASVRADFPALHQEIHGKPLAYLDNAASTMKPRAVVDAIRNFYERDYSNIHRGVHQLSQRATAAYEAVRAQLRGFLGVPSQGEIVFTRGTTEAINLVAQSYARPRLRPGDEILLTHLEHHSNIVPWQMVCEQTGASLVVAPINDEGEVELDAMLSLLSPSTKLVAMAHVSNALGTITPVEEVIEAAHAVGAPVLLDGAQAVAHLAVDLEALDVDFYALSAHKMYGPTGVGALYGKAELLESMPPWEGGGDMIRSVSFEKTTYASPPARFEAGTPNIAGVVGLGAAIDYLEGLDLEAAHRHEDQLLEHASSILESMDQARIVGRARRKTAVLSFELEGVHPHDVGTVLDMAGVAIRAGHHCAQPVMDRFGIPATARASLAVYNTREDLDALFAGIEKTLELLG
jgi:cysteine desulfurase/selenocysteine lyase